MPDNGKPATGPLIYEQVIQIASMVDDLRQALATHTGAAVEHRKRELKEIADLTQDTHYYGDQLIGVYKALNKNIQRLSEQLDRVLTTEHEKAA